MAEPGEFNIIAHRNVTKTINLTLESSPGVPFDLTNYTVTADAVGAILPAGRVELSPSKVAPDTDGVISIVLAKATTGSWTPTDGLSPGEIPNWDLLLTDGSDVTTKVLQGKLYIRETYTT